MNWVDIIIIIVALIFAWIGWKQGFIRIVFTIAGLIAGVAIAGQLKDPFADILSPAGAAWAKPLAFAIIVIIVLIVGSLIGSIARRILRFLMLGWPDKILGPIIGLLIGALLCAAIFTIILEAQVALPGKAAVENAIIGSPLASLLIEHFGLILGLLPGEVGERVRGVFRA